MSHRWWTLIVVSVVVFMVMLDLSVVYVALPSIQRAMHSNLRDLEWVVDAYALTLAAVLLTAGALADLWGRKQMFLCGLIVFTAASAVCGFSVDPLMLNLARGIQGIGGAMMMPAGLALIAQTFVDRDRGVAFGVLGATMGVSMAAGPLLGGLITTTIGWEWVFFLNVPVGISAIMITYTRVPESRDPHAVRADWMGCISFSAALFLLVFALLESNTSGLTSTTVVMCLGGSAALLALFIVVERVQSHPMLDLALFRRRSFTGINIVAFCLSASAIAVLLYLTLYLQTVDGYSALQAGLRTLPSTLPVFAAAAIAGRLSVRVPVRLLLGAGLLLIAGGLLAMTAVGAYSRWTVLIPGMTLLGIGVGLVTPPLTASSTAVVPASRSGTAAGINRTFRQVGVAVGVAGLGAVFQHRLVSHTKATLLSSGRTLEVLAMNRAHIAARLEAGELTQFERSLAPIPRHAFLHAYRVGFTDALTSVLLVAALVALVGAGLAVALVHTRDLLSSVTTAESTHDEAPYLGVLNKPLTPVSSADIDR